MAESDNTQKPPAKQSSSRHLLPEKFYSFQPSLANALGLDRAIIIQRFHFFICHEKNGRMIDGERWLWNTYEGWSREFDGMWAPKTIADHIRKLEKTGVLVSRRISTAPGVYVKFYKIDHDKLDEIADGKPVTENQPPPTGSGTSDIPEVGGYEPTESGTFLYKNNEDSNEDLQREIQDVVPVQDTGSPNDSPDPSPTQPKRNLIADCVEYFRARYAETTGIPCPENTTDYSLTGKHLKTVKSMEPDEAFYYWCRAVDNLFASESKVQYTFLWLVNNYRDIVVRPFNQFGNNKQQGVKTDERKSFKQQEADEFAARAAATKAAIKRLGEVGRVDGRSPALLSDHGTDDTGS